ncbi:hypothetical protein [Methylorubrum extorquens]
MTAVMVVVAPAVMMVAPAMVMMATIVVVVPPSVMAVAPAVMVMMTTVVMMELHLPERVRIAGQGRGRHGAERSRVRRDRHRAELQEPGKRQGEHRSEKSFRHRFLLSLQWMSRMRTVIRCWPSLNARAY